MLTNVNQNLLTIKQKYHRTYQIQELMQNCAQIPQSSDSRQTLCLANELQEFDRTLVMAETTSTALISLYHLAQN